MGHVAPTLDDVRAKVAGRLSRRRVIVTGAASGIGQAIAELFAVAGARVAALDRAPSPSPVGGLSLQADVTEPTSIANAVAQAVTAFGGLDGLVNAAGIANTDMLESVTVEDWKRVIDVNLTGSFIVSQACLPALRESGSATIVNLSSGQGLQPFVRRGAYAASKAGVIALTKCLAMEWAPTIRVNTLCPGAVDTPMVRSGYDAETLRTQVGPRYALQRIGEPLEIALAALYLSSEESSFVTGITLAVDGGRSYH
jgi:NAD(P)-dependent dehydrogenase (short-subunit alcohol dehydrogenase family)